MARPIKTGLEYFPLDTEWDVKMQLVKARFGLIGIGCIIELYKLIYHEGYALKWDNDNRLLFAAENHIDEKELSDIIVFATDKGVFSTEKYNALGILTSRGIQKRWLRVAKESNRAIKTINPVVNLIGDNSTQETLPIPKTELPIPIIPDMNELSVPESTHIILHNSKVKYSKGKKSAERKTETVCVGEFKNVILSKAYLDKMFNLYGQDQLEAMIGILSTYMSSSGKKYKNCAGALSGWVMREYKPVPLQEREHE